MAHHENKTWYYIVARFVEGVKMYAIYPQVEGKVYEKGVIAYFTQYGGAEDHVHLVLRGHIL